MKTFFTYTHPLAALPLHTSGNPQSPTYDLLAVEEIILAPRSTTPIALGLTIHLPSTHYALIVPCPGLAFRHAITILNSPHIISNDKPRKLTVLLHNISSKEFTLRVGRRVANLLFANTPSTIHLTDKEPEDHFKPIDTSYPEGIAL